MTEHTFKTIINGIILDFVTTPGVFSWKHVDDGTQLLLRNLDVEVTDTVLDIGCGYGPIGIYCAKIASKGKVTMIDKDFVAIEYAQKNVTLNKVSNATASLSNMLNNLDPAQKFSLIVSNLPANVGKDVWNVLLEQAYAALEPGGRIYIVTIKNLKEYIKRKFTETFGNYTKIAHNNYYVVNFAEKSNVNNEAIN